MVTIKLSKQEARVTLDALNHLSAYTSEEKREHLGWTMAEQRAWDIVVGKFSHVVAEG